MKKMISLILAFCMAVMLVPALAESADIAGEWIASFAGNDIPMTITHRADAQYLSTRQADNSLEQMPGKLNAVSAVIAAVSTPAADICFSSRLARTRKTTGPATVRIRSSRRPLWMRLK